MNEYRRPFAEPGEGRRPTLTWPGQLPFASIESIYVRSAALAQRLLAFDPKGLLGERTYDCANTLCNPVMPELVHNERRLLTNAAILADTLALEVSRVLAYTYAYACLNATWWLRLGGDDIVEWALKVAVIIEPHIESL